MAQEVKYLSYSGLSHFKDRVFEVINPLISENKANILSIQNFLEKPVFEEVNINTLNVIDEINLNGSRLFNFDFLPLSGGALTGPLSLNGSDTDRNLIRVNCSTSGDDSQIGNYGYTLKFLGSGTGVNNALALYADNQASTTQNLATKWLNDGTMYGRSILPHTTNTFDLGSSSLKWKNIYATTFIGNLTGNVTGHLNGTISMQAGTANAYRNILVTNGSDGVCYSSAGNVQLNYSTGDVKATSFTGNLNGNATSATTATKIGTYTANDIFVRQSRPDNGFNIDEIELFGMRDIQPSSEITREGTFPFDGWGSLMSFNGSNYFVQLATQGTSAGLYFRSAYGSAVKLTDKPWVKFLDSSNYSSYALPLGGGTMTGAINSQNIIPTSNSSYNLGSSSKQFNTTYTRYLDTTSGYILRLKAEGTEHLNMSSGAINATANILPTATNTYNLGSSNYKWNNIYANKIVANSFVENGEYLSSKYADKAYADYCSSYLHSANRAQFCKPAGVTLEYSTDSGSTWVDYGATDEQKIGFFSGISQGFYLGKKLSTKALASDMLRLTMDATAMGFYTSCKSLLINISTNGSSNFRVKVERSMKGSVDTFTTLIESQTLTGWSGWNRIPIGYSYGGGDTQDWNIAKLRLTFMSDGAGSSYTSGAHSCILDMEVLGSTYWGVPHTMAKTGHIYSWDYLGNTIFSKNITANSFIGTSASLTGPLTITGTDETTATLHFGRTSYNYISGPSGSTIHMCPGGISRSSTTGYIFSSTAFYPGTTNAYSIGSSSKQWNNIYGKTIYENGTALGDKYLKLTGGTISSSAFCPLVIERSGSTNMAALRFKNSNGILGSIGMNVVYGSLLLHNADGTENKTILDSSNYNTYAAAKSHNHSAANITSGTLSVSRGGTGLSTITTGHVIIGNGTGTPTTAKIAELSDNEIDSIFNELGVTF